MFWFYLADYLPERPLPNGRGWSYSLPLPEDVGFRLLAGPGFDPPWGVFGCGAEVPLSAHVRAVPEDTRRTLYAAQQYPPALALAREALAFEFEGREPTAAAFCARYAEVLRAHMRRQPEAGYLFVEGAGAPGGLVERGRFYWVLGHNPATGRVRFARGGDWVVEAQAADFALTAAQLTALPA